MAYEQIKREELILRDELAIERTKLAEERTALAYLRTGMSMVLGGIFFVGYFQSGTIFSYVGYSTIILALVFIGYGFYTHQKSKDLINRIISGVFSFKK